MAADFLCIGAQKAGTSWLDAMLRQHPGVFLPPMKEVHFFDFVYIPEHRPWIRSGFRKNAARLGRDPALAPYLARLAEIPRRRDAWYAAVFDHPAADGRLKGEITPAYAILPAEGIARVRALNPEMLVLFILRDPLARALSQLRMTAGRNGWPMVNADRVAAAGLMPAVLARSGYRESIARWEAAFPAHQLLCLPYGEMRRDPEGFLRRVEGFLGLEPGRYARLGASVHASPEVEVAPELVAELERALAPERAWLAARFGAGFAL